MNATPVSLFINRLIFSNERVVDKVRFMIMLIFAQMALVCPNGIVHIYFIQNIIIIPLIQGLETFKFHSFHL